jgi:hypothetical protein
MRRREARWMVEVPILLEVGKKLFDLLTEDVSHSGLFVRLEEPLALRTLVKVSLLLPPRGAAFKANARVCHNLPAVRGGDEAGVGLELFGLGSDDTRRWDAFIALVRERYPGSAEHRAILARGVGIDPVVKRDPEYVLVLAIHLRSLEDLVLMLKRDISARKLFVVTPARAEIGDRIGLWIVHPHTDDVFELSATVKRRVSDGTLGGLLLDLSDLTNDRIQRLEEFTFDAVEPLFDDPRVDPEP